MPVIKSRYTLIRTYARSEFEFSGLHNEPQIKRARMFIDLNTVVGCEEYVDEVLQGDKELIWLHITDGVSIVVECPFVWMRERLDQLAKQKEEACLWIQLSNN